jgi:hypothetical protein
MAGVSGQPAAATAADFLQAKVEEVLRASRSHQPAVAFDRLEEARAFVTDQLEPLVRADLYYLSLQLHSLRVCCLAQLTQTFDVAVPVLEAAGLVPGGQGGLIRAC